MKGNPHPTRPFVKGDPRINRHGRPKSGETMADIIHQVFKEEIVVEAAKGKTKREVRMIRKRLLIEALFNRAVRDSDAAARLLLNYHDGMPSEHVTISSEGEDEKEKILAARSEEELDLLIAIYDGSKKNGGRKKADIRRNGNGTKKSKNKAHS